MRDRRVHRVGRRQNIDELRLGSIDIAVDQSYAEAPHLYFEGLDQTVLLTEPLFLLTPAGSGVASVAAAEGWDWVASPPSSACGRSTRSIAARAGFAPRVRYETDDHFATVRLVSAGLAVAIVPLLALLHRPTDVDMHRIPRTHRTLSAVTRPAARARPAVTAVIEHLQAAAAELDTDEIAA